MLARIKYQRGTKIEEFRIPSLPSPDEKRRLVDQLILRACNVAVITGDPEIIIEAPICCVELVESRLSTDITCQKITTAATDYFQHDRVFHCTVPPKGLTELPKKLSVLWQDENLPSGIGLGIDVGGSHTKTAVMSDSASIVLDVISGGSYTVASPAKLLSLIQMATSSAIQSVSNRAGFRMQASKISGITVSMNCAVRNGTPISFHLKGRLGNPRKFDKLLETYRRWVRDELSAKVAARTTMLNDGCAGACFAARLFRAPKTVFLGLGSSVAYGYVNEDGKIPPYSLIHYLRTTEDSHNGFNDAPLCVLGAKLGVRGIASVASELGMHGMCPHDFKSAHNSAEIILREADTGNHLALQIASVIGKEAAGAIREIGSIIDVRQVAIGGGIASGQFGKQMVIAMKQEMKNCCPYQCIEIKGCGGNSIWASALGAAWHAVCGAS